ncbi:nuclear factor erythroid 2-related factor 3 isoform X1 [Dasypus novemcinctus]|uniref:nuclear factor erythroid 2-related factor 3 isoform X1 n=1 Tax=Dasypus novemcinctus TaxID=9361 RepID=UPI000328EAF4|nr:nuclear factor erythroid 2-related factor 3 isoform X1 [Dasypus novemcinctus]
MKILKPWRLDSGGFLHLTILLSLTGLRVDLDLYLLLPPPTLLPAELLLLGGPTSSACALSPFPASERWRRAGLLHPKGRELEPAAPLEGQLLREVRALGAPFIPRTRVDAWLVHSVAAGAADGTAASTAGVGASVDGDGQASPGGGGDPRAARRGPLAAEEEETPPVEPTAEVPNAGGRANEEIEILRESCEAVDYSSQHEESELRLSAQKEASPQQNSEDENKIAAKPDWEAEKTTEPRNEWHLNGTDTISSLEDLLQLLSSQPENSLEGISLGDIPPFPSSSNDGMNSSAHFNEDFSQAISHDVSLHEAMLLCPNTTFGRDSVSRTSQQQEPFLPLNSPTTNPEQSLPGTNLTGFLPPFDNQIWNLTSQDLLYDLDVNIFDEINLVSLAMEGFDPMLVSQLFKEPDPDSGLSLNSSHCSTSVTKSNSSHSVCDEGAVGYTSDLDSLFCHDLGAVDYYPEPGKCSHMDQSDSGLHEGLAFQHIFHNHTYHLQTSAPESTSKSLSWPGKSQKMSRYLDGTGRNLSRDERRAKALQIPFSVDEIVRMPVDSFNSMLSRYYLTDLQVSLIRDIRRRGKNKVAAQNCRKRKLDVILNLEDDIYNLKAKKEALEREQAQCNKAINIMKHKLHDLYRDVFNRLRDDQGRPVNPNQYALQHSHDGSVLIVPKELVTLGPQKENQKRKRKSQRRN